MDSLILIFHVEQATVQNALSEKNERNTQYHFKDFYQIIKPKDERVSRNVYLVISRKRTVTIEWW